jgi:hypothetical protein
MYRFIIVEGAENWAFLLAARDAPSKPDLFCFGLFLRWFKEDNMKNRIWVIALLIVVLTAFSSVQRANAEPLTVMAIVGVAAVISASTVDIVASNYEENRDMRAQQEDIGKLHAKAETTGDEARSSEARLPLPKTD